VICTAGLFWPNSIISSTMVRNFNKIDFWKLQFEIFFLNMSLLMQPTRYQNLLNKPGRRPLLSFKVNEVTCFICESCLNKNVKQQPNAHQTSPNLRTWLKPMTICIYIYIKYNKTKQKIKPNLCCTKNTLT